jgi:hypothetical protein
VHPSARMNTQASRRITARAMRRPYAGEEE